MHKLFVLSAVLCVLTFFTRFTFAEPAPSANNIIMVIADGMGAHYPSAYRLYKAKENNNNIQSTIFDKTMVGMVSTAPDMSSGFVTDSAAAATALASGVKTYNGAIGLDSNKNPVDNVLAFAKRQGMATGVVVTSELTHATPAAYLSHAKQRSQRNLIADQFIDKKINGSYQADVILGGGIQYFERSDRNLVNEFKALGFQVLYEYKQLNELAPNQATLGLFADDALPPHIDDHTPHRLTLMTQAAIKQLESIAPTKGYFLLIEASQIDWAAHDNDVLVAMTEMAELEHTMEYLFEYSKENPNTTVVLTSDHNTGGLTIGSTKQYRWSPKLLHNIKQSPHAIAMQLAANKLAINELNNILGFKLTLPEIEALNKAFKPANDMQTVNKADIAKVIRNIINQRTNTGWTSEGHTGSDVPIYSFGKNQADFIGFQDNTDIAKKIFLMLEKSNQ